jgi:HlyD family secretion protein
MSTRSKRRRILVWITAGALAVAGGAALAWPRLAGPRVAVVVAEQGPFAQTIVTSGRVRPLARASLATLVAGRVATLGADEGQKIRAGEELMQLDDSEAQATLDQAKAAVDAASVQVRQVRTVSLKDAREQVARAQTRLDEAQRTHERIGRLFAGGAATRETLEDAGTALSLAESELRAAQNQEADISGTRRASSNAAKHQAEAALAASRARFAYHRLTAPFDGVVIARMVEQGDVVQAGTPAFVVVREGATELVIEPDERNLALLAVGQSATASSEAFPDDRFAATVTYIAPAVDPRRGTIEVRLAVPAPPAYLRPDMTVSVEIVVAERASTTILPADAVRGLAEGKPWILVVQGAHAERRDVAVGMSGDTRVEVVRGVEAGERVIPASARVAPGERVRVAAEPR